MYGLGWGQTVASLMGHQDEVESVTFVPLPAATTNPNANRSEGGTNYGTGMIRIRVMPVML